MASIVAVPVSRTTLIGLAMMNVPRAEPPMMTYSQGCQMTMTWPPMATKPPSSDPIVMIRPMMIAKARAPSQSSGP